ncbi:MAG: 30S ribosomal protein S8 [Planctomycetota bacterium]|nr:30S ribosomal protein S8 [Planctomycetota bacterium]
MSLSDPIADMLTRIRNAAGAGHKAVNIRASGICEGVVRVLKEEGYIADYTRIDDGVRPAGLLRVYLRYSPNGEQVISELKRVSRPGQRRYSGADDLPRPMDGMGVAIISTSKGVLSDRRCREENVGGEVLCTVC